MEDVLGHCGSCAAVWRWLENSADGAKNTTGLESVRASLRRSSGKGFWAGKEEDYCEEDGSGEVKTPYWEVRRSIEIAIGLHTARLADPEYYRAFIDEKSGRCAVRWAFFAWRFAWERLSDWAQFSETGSADASERAELTLRTNFGRYLFPGFLCSGVRLRANAVLFRELLRSSYIHLCLAYSGCTRSELQKLGAEFIRTPVPVVFARMAGKRKWVFEWIHQPQIRDFGKLVFASRTSGDRTAELSKILARIANKPRPGVAAGDRPR
jgi:hypothetical protein